MLNYIHKECTGKCLVSNQLLGIWQKRGWVSCFQSYSKYILLEGKGGEWWGRVEKGTFTVFQSEVKLASNFLGKGFKGIYTDFISVIQ